ncbi:hypothetical protein JRQ81_004078 [Phrynocephalus forsythii]|uniref:Coilin n=1 Tax=Phrynocephalus forsythii TaxID=171643 RepID=A0A9Q0XLR4_9SAUR|nr:hypothetical protein JRQ81_004078 [Phrynocephalus forsythii]
MAAAGSVGVGEAPVRLRLLFDYPPPSSPACGLCWLLLEPSQVRLVTDLVSLIREKFGFSRRAQLSLFLDGALLPPTESARLVRDNDALRVKLEEVLGGDSSDQLTNGFCYASKKPKKRHWQKLEASVSGSEEEHRKRKKSKHHFEHLSSQEESAQNVLDSVTPRKRKKAHSKSDDDLSHLKKLRKNANKEKETEGDNKKKKARQFETKNTSQKAKKISPLHVSRKNTAENTTRSHTKKDGTSNESSTSSSECDDSIVDTNRKHSHRTKVASQQTDRSQPSSSLKAVSSTKRAAEEKGQDFLKAANSKKANVQSSSSDSGSTSEEEQQSSNLKTKLPCNNKGIVAAPVTDLASKTKPSTSSLDSDSSASGSLIVKKPKTIASQPFARDGGQQLPAATWGPSINPSDIVRGRGRGETPFWRGPRVRGCRGLVRGRGRGRGESTSFYYNYSDEHQKQQQLTEAATNTSIVIQNPVEAPKKDYSKLPLLAAPPQVGEKIAFKLLELTENYTPEVSDYKEGKIISWNPVNKQLELEILSFSSVEKEPGKFDLVYQSADGTETVEYAVSKNGKITESWDAFIEPRLLVDPSDKEPSPKNGAPSDVNTFAPGANSL